MRTGVVAASPNGVALPGDWRQFTRPRSGVPETGQSIRTDGLGRLTAARPLAKFLAREFGKGAAAHSRVMYLHSGETQHDGNRVWRRFDRVRDEWPPTPKSVRLR